MTEEVVERCRRMLENGATRQQVADVIGGRENNLQVPPGDLKTKISLLFLICYVWLNQFIQL
jgi:hypothetical protein